VAGKRLRLPPRHETEWVPTFGGSGRHSLRASNKRLLEVGGVPPSESGVWLCRPAGLKDLPRRGTPPPVIRRAKRQAKSRTARPHLRRVAIDGENLHASVHPGKAAIASTVLDLLRRWRKEGSGDSRSTRLKHPFFLLAGHAIGLDTGTVSGLWVPDCPRARPSGSFNGQAASNRHGQLTNHPGPSRKACGKFRSGRALVCGPSPLSSSLFGK
jgi:hypothetical protein